uniref:heme-binding protein 2 n=1 Tax=Semicossyphus pulcher TaxID=241346 RepID=UPI0037E76A6B
MIFLSGLVGILLVLTAEARVGNSSESSLCTETEECLLFNPICENDYFEARHYQSSKWVTIEETSFIMEIAATRAFKQLFEYINGGNDQGKKIAMTSPVLMKVPEETRFLGMCVYSMSFLLPSIHQKNPPIPTNSKVHIHEMPEMKVYVESYDGWMMSISDKFNAHELRSALDAEGAMYERDYHYAVCYNSPMKMLNRHNEVWYIAKGEPECSSSEELEFSLFD